MSYNTLQFTRPWTRVDNICGGVDSSSNTQTSATKQNTKQNSARLTKRQLYAQIAKGNGPYRKKSWASQSMNFPTNPNSHNLQQIGNTLRLCPKLLPGQLLIEHWDSLTDNVVITGNARVGQTTKYDTATNVQENIKSILYTHNGDELIYDNIFVSKNVYNLSYVEYSMATNQTAQIQLYAKGFSDSNYYPITNVLDAETTNSWNAYIKYSFNNPSITFNAIGVHSIKIKIVQAALNLLSIKFV